MGVENGVGCHHPLGEESIVLSLPAPARGREGPCLSQEGDSSQQPGACSSLLIEDPVGKTSQHNAHCSAGILHRGAGHTGDFSSKRACQAPCYFSLNTVTYVNIHGISKNCLAYVNIFHVRLLAALGGLQGS